MDINKVVFGNFSMGPQRGRSEKEEVKEEAQTSANVGSEKKLDAETVYNALDAVAVQNKAQIVQTDKKEVNPADYLSDDRMKDIEAMMGKFENGVGTIADAIEEELPGFFAADIKNALAARIFAQE